MLESEFLTILEQLLATGANGATIAIFVFLYKLDKRVFVLESFHAMRRKDDK